MRVIQAVNKVEIPGPATSGTDSETPGELRFGAGRKRTRLLMADVNPFDLYVLMNGIDDAIQ